VVRASSSYRLTMTRPNEKDIALARKADVAIMDGFIGTEA
jgi:hypothetical protein